MLMQLLYRRVLRVLCFLDFACDFYNIHVCLCLWLLPCRPVLHPGWPCYSRTRGTGYSISSQVTNGQHNSHKWTKWIAVVC